MKAADRSVVDAGREDKAARRRSTQVRTPTIRSGRSRRGTNHPGAGGRRRGVAGRRAVRGRLHGGLVRRARRRALRARAPSYVAGMDLSWGVFFLGLLGRVLQLPGWQRPSSSPWTPVCGRRPEMGLPDVSLTEGTNSTGEPALLPASRSRLRIDKNYR